jgi:basic amino acid/polyamine antiporter, APA family
VKPFFVPENFVYLLMRKQEITLLGLVMVVLGSTIGSGIFSTPAAIAQDLPDEGWIYLVWIIGGLITLSGAVLYARLSREFSGPGGVYLFLRKAYGKPVAFLYGWSILTVITSGAVSAITLVTVDYLRVFIELSEFQAFLLAAGIVLFHGIVHSRGVKIGEIVLNALTVSKFLGLLAVIAFGLFFIPKNESVSGLITHVPVQVGGFAVALVAVLWSFGGFQHASFLAGESKNAAWAVPRAMIIGTILVTGVYLLINFTLIQGLGLERLMQSEKPVADLLALGSDMAGKLVAALVILSTFGAGFVFTMSAPRIYEVMAEDGVFFSFLAKRHKRYGTPANAILTQALWSIVLLAFWGTFKALIMYSTFMDWVFLGAAGFSVFVLIPFKEIGFLVKFSGVLFSMAVLSFLVIVLMQGPEQAYYGLGLLLAGLFVYLIFSRKSTSYGKG